MSRLPVGPEPLDVHFPIRVSRSEKRAVEERIENLGMTRSDYLRSLIARDLKSARRAEA